MTGLSRYRIRSMVSEAIETVETSAARHQAADRKIRETQLSFDLHREAVGQLDQERRTELSMMIERVDHLQDSVQKQQEIARQIIKAARTAIANAEQRAEAAEAEAQAARQRISRLEREVLVLRLKERGSHIGALLVENRKPAARLFHNSSGYDQDR